MRSRACWPKTRAGWPRWSRSGSIPMSDDKRTQKLSKLDKAAIFLLSLGESDAAAVLRHMGPKEVQRVGSAMAGLRTVNRDQVQQVMADFIEVASDQTGLGVGALRSEERRVGKEWRARGWG